MQRYKLDFFVRVLSKGKMIKAAWRASAIAMTFGARMSLPQLRGSDTAAADDVAMPRSFAWRAISCYLMCNRGAYEMRLESCARDFTSSFRKALPRWYSTVFGLMNS